MQIKFRRHQSTSEILLLKFFFGLENKRPPYWNYSSGFDFDRDHRRRYFIFYRNTKVKFYPNT